MTSQPPPQSPRDFDVGVARRLAKLESQLEYLRSIIARGDQATDTASSVTFDSIKVGPVSTNPGTGAVFADSLFYAKVNGSGGGFYAGDVANLPDVQLYRSAANTWRTPDNLTVDGEITTGLVGTWTPAFAGTGTAGVFTYTNQAGYYIKIGGMVFVFARVSISAIGTPPTGMMTISGLPFNCDATYYGSVNFGQISNFNYAAGAVDLTALVATSASFIYLNESFDNLANAAVPAANFTNAACDLIFSGFYLL